MNARFLISLSPRSLSIFAIASACSFSMACSSSSTPAVATEATSPQSITVTENEFSLVLTPPTAKPGRVTFNATNAGAAGHEVVVFKTDLAADQLPTNADGTVNEEGAGLTKIDPEIDDLTAGASKSAALELAAGNYVVVCNIGQHYKKGMRASFTVR